MGLAEHKYTELADRLRRDICAGTYATGQKLPSENELAASTGFSRQTIRQAMGVLEREGLTDRVRGSGTYVRSTAVRRATTRNIAVVTTYIGEYIFPDILHGIESELTAKGYTPLLSATHNRVDNERRILKELLEKPIDGLLVEGTKTALPNPNIDLYRQLAQKGIPTVFLNGYYRELEDPIYVVADDQAGGQQACAMLIAGGHRHIAGIFKSDDLQGLRRYAGYMQTLQDAGLSAGDEHVLWFTTTNRDAQLEHHLPELLAGYTACVCYNDEVAFQVARHLQEQGGPAVELVSFDNSTFVQFSPLPFRSLSNPKEELGRVAAEKLLRLLAGKLESPAVLPWKLLDQA